MSVRWLLLLCLGAVACQEAYAAPFSRGKAFWPFGHTSVTPDSGVADSGVADSGPADSGVPPFTNNFAIDMSSGESLTTPDAVDLDCTDQMSVSVWIQRKLTGSPYIARRWGALAADQSWEFRIDSTDQTQMLAHFSSNAIGVRTDGASIINDSWTHVVLVYDGTLGNSNRVNIYQDGTPRTFDIYSGSIPITLKNSSQTFDIHTVVTTQMWFDEFAFWCIALSSAQVNAIYNAGSPTDLSSYAPLLWYRFEDSGNTSIADSSGSHTGTYTGAGSDYTSSVP